MKKFYLILLAFLAVTVSTNAQQLPNNGFEDWSGDQFDGNIQPATWNYSNVTQFGFKFNFAHQETGHTGKFCAMVQDQEVGAAGITETSPGYFSLGQPWVYIKSLTTVNQATAGDKGSISWKTRPDTMQVWIKRTGDNVLREDFHLLFYSWKGTAKGSKYQGKNEDCTSVGESYIDEESDVRQALDANRCGTDVKATQVAEGWWRERKEYGSWTCINVPIYYFNDEVPEKCNVIFSASNYPNFRANSGLYAGNSLYVDDVKMIYSSQIQSLYIGGKKWNGFVPTSTEEQEYSLGEKATEIPEIYAMRGQGSLTNTKGTTATFPGRKLTSSECVINYGTIDGTPTTITVKAEDGSSTTVYKIKFVRAASTNSRLGGIQVNGEDIAGFNAYKFDYNYELPYGTTAAPVLTVTQAEDAQTVTITQAGSTTGTATIKVVAADKKTTSTYTVKFSVAKLSDNTLKDITVGGESLKGFLPTKNLYTVELPLGTTAVPEIKAVSAYKAGEQTIEYNNQGLEKPFEIKVTVPGNANSRTYKLNFKITASSYVYLQDLQVAGYDINFEQGKKVYYISLPVGTSTIPEVTYVAGDKYQTINKVTEVDTDNPDRTWVKITVTAGNGDQLIYKIAFDQIRSTVTTLNGISIDGKALAGFDPNTYKYDVELPIGTTKLPSVTFTKGDNLQQVAVNTSEIDPSDNTATVRLTVTADNGDQAVYVINFTIAQADNTTLLMIFVNGEEIPNFDPNVRAYDCVLPLGTKNWPTVTWTAHDEWQTVATRQGTFNSSKTNVMKVNVTSGAGTAGTYELSFTVAAASKNTALKSIAVNGTNIPDFSATTYAYNYKLPMGTTETPVVSAEKAEAAQTVTVTQAKSVTGTATIKVVAEDKSVYKNYTVTFSVEASSNVALTSISIGGQKIAGFNPEVLEYNVELPAGTKVLPDITCETDGYQTVSVRNELVNLTGDYKIVVTAPSGATRTYVLHISVVTSSNAELGMIYSGGTKLADFDKNKTEYVISLPVGTTTVPALTYDKGDEGQTINVIPGGLDGVTEIVVRAADGKTTKTYSITYVIEKASNTTLNAIKVGGTLIAGFNPEVTNYTYDLTSKTTVLPAVTYEAHDAYQTIVVQTDYMIGLEGDYKIIVRAQTGDTRIYTITFRIVISSNSQLNGITIGGVALEGFESSKKDYNIELPIGTTELPVIAYTAGDDAQTITVNKGDVNGKTTIVVKAENGTTSTYTLNFTVKKANDTTLKSIKIDGVEIEGFRADSTYYEVDLKSTTTVLPTVTFEQHDVYQTVTVRTDEMDGLTGTYKIVVRAQTGDTRVYSIKFSIVISSNAALKEIFIGGEPFLEYTKDQLDYTYYLDLGTTKAPEITYTPGDEFQQISENFRGLNGRNEIIVVAQDGTKRTYSITFVVAKSNKTHLTKITVDGKELEDFSFDKSDYTVQLTNASDHGRTDVPVIGFTKAEDEQKVSVVYGSINGTSKIVVVAENGTDSRTYTIRFELPVSNNCTLSNITISAGSWSGFSADKTEFSIALPLGTTELPEINAIKGDDWQKVIISRGTIETATTIMVIAENGDRKEYTLNFSVVKSAEAQVEMIAIGDQEIPAFSPSTYSYVFQLAEGLTECPEIVVTKKDESQQVTIVKPATTGLATVICVAENGTQSTYKVDVRAYDTRSNNCKLANLTVEGVMIEGFDPLEMKYAYVLPAGSTELPDIDWTLGEEHQGVAITRGTVTDTTYIRVLAENKIDFNIYKIAFSVAPYSNAQLKELWVGAENILTDEEEYTVLLTKDAKACPDIRPIAMDNTQAIVMTSPVLTGDAVIKVLSAMGEEKIYTIHFVSTLSDDANLSSITIDGQEIPNFVADVTDYDILLPSGTKTLPEVGYVKKDEQQVEVFTGGLEGTTTILVTAENGDVQQYTLNFTIDRSNAAELQMIYLDGVELANFNSATKDYNYTLAQGAESAPVVTATATSPEQTLIIVQPVLTGKAQIQVRSEDESEEAIYTVNFQFEQLSDATLESVKLNDELIEGFDPNTFDYTLTRSTDQIVGGCIIDYVKRDSMQTVIVENNGVNGVKIYVEAESGATATYTIAFDIAKSSLAKLEGLRFYTYNSEEAEGRYFDFGDFEEDTYNYSYTLPRLSTVVPAIYPIKSYDAQRVTINYGAVNESTTILVEAEDGTSATYTIDFQVAKSTNTKLKELKIAAETRDVEETEFDIVLDANWQNDYSTEVVSELIEYVAEPEQSIEFKSAPFGKPSVIKVKAESGDVRTYTINFSLAIPAGDNVLKAIDYTYKNADGADITGTINNPTVGENKVQLPFGSTSFMITGTTKNYDLQTVTLLNAGIRRPSTILVASNKADMEDVEYTVTPEMPEFETAGKLSDLKFKGATIDNFKPYIYNYMVGVTAEPSVDDFVGTAYNDAEVTKSGKNTTKKQITLTVASGETYSVCWYYINDGKYQKNGQYYDYLDFSQEWQATPAAPMWKATATSSASATSTMKSTGFKPYGWTVPADLVAGFEYDISVFGQHVVDLFWMSGKEVIAAGVNGVMLSTINGASINGSVPGMMTLGGTMTLKPNKSGGSQSGITYSTNKFITMRNTPDSLSMQYKSLSAENISGWYYELLTVAGSTTRTNKFEGNFASATWRYASLPITAYNNAMSKYALTINSCHTTNAGDMGGSNTIYTSDVQVEDIHFVYNSDLTAVTVNDQPTTKSGNTFTYTLAANEDVVGVPVLTFEQKVHDQTRTIEWLNNGEWVEGKLTAKVTNYGENMSDNTVYYVVLQRPAVTDLEINIPGTWTQKDEAHFEMVLPNGTRTLPDLTITPHSIHQKVSISRQNWTYTVTVENESGESVTRYYTYVESKSNSTMITISMTGIDFDAATTDYEVKASTWASDLLFSKASDGQTVTYTNTPSSRIVKVVAEDGTTTQTYTINRTEDVKSSGKLAKVWVNASEIEVAPEMSTNLEVKRGIAFLRDVDSETVEQIFTADTVYWNVTANAGGVTSYKLGFEQIKSSDATLKSIFVNGQLIEGFNSTLTSYRYRSADKAFVLDAQTTDDAAKMTITYSNNVATIIVTAEDGTVGTPYEVNFIHQANTNSLLAMIYIDGDSLKGFNPYVYEYNITLPTAMPKMADPAMPNITFTGAADGQTYSVENYGASVYINVKAESGVVTSYTLNLTAELMTDASLKALYVNGKSLLQSGHTEYSVILPNEEEPDVRWFTVSPYQTVDMIPHASFDELDELVVTAENGAEKTYFISYTVDPLFYSAQLQGIILDGDTLTDFRSDIYSYIIPIDNTKSAIPNMEAILKHDNQQVVISSANINEATTIEVTAADGQTKQLYSFTFQETKSSDASLLGISVDYDPIVPFDKDQMNYEVEVENTAYTIQTVQSNFAQKVMQVRDGNVTKLIVVAEDGTTRTYNVTVTIAESATSSSNSYLKSIRVDGNEIADFRQDSLFYIVDLPEGTTTLPDLTVEAGAYGQTITFSFGNLQTSTVITVLAKNGVSSRQYGVRYNVKTSDIDSLKMIYLDGEPLADFDSKKLDYSIEMDNRTFPFVTYAKGIASQTVIVDTLSGNAYTQRLALRVKAASGAAQRTYNLTMNIKKATADTLRMIFLDGQPMADFESTRNNYDVVMPLGSTSYPEISYTEGDDHQSVVFEVQSAAAGTAVYALRVTAESGAVRIYTLNLTIAKSELTDLRNILVNGETLVESGKGYTSDFGFSPDVHYYNLAWNIGTVDIPQITYARGDEYQHVEMAHQMSTLNDSVVLRVVAENGESAMYIIRSELKHSDVDVLKMIYINSLPLEGFDALKDTFIVDLPVGTRNFPTYEAVRGDQWQAITTNTIDLTTYRAEYAITVLAENGNKRVYTLIFNVAKSENSALGNIRINGEAITTNGIGYKADYDFDPEQLNYHLSWAVGTQNLPVVDFVLDDFQSLTMVHSMTSLEDSVIVDVVSENSDVRTYKVFNTLLHSTVDTLRNIYVNNMPLEGFDAQKDSFIVELPVGTRNFPTYETIRGDQWQVITTKSLSQSMYEAWNEITVTAEAGNTRTYHLGFQIAKSNLTTLRAIRVNGLTLTTEGLGYTADADFAPETTTYHLDWEVGTTDMPQITYVAGDAYQVVEYLNTMRSVNDSLQIRVTAESGDMNTYTVFNTLLHSAVDTLQMIYVNNLPLENFDAHKDTFIVTLPVGTRSFPMAEAVKGERLQTLSQSVLSSTAYERVIRYTVVAEDGTTTRQYILIFRVEKSAEQMLDALLVNGELIVEQGSGYVSDADFEPSHFEYNLLWEVGTETAPVFTFEMADTLQTVYVVHEAYSANDSLVLRVEAENGEYQLYTVRNTLLHSSVDTLAMIYVDNLAVADFRGAQTVYDIALPVGRRSFPTIDYDKGDEYQDVAVDTLSVGTYEATYRIRVQAEDGVNSRAYTVHFVVTKSSKDNLEAIYLNDKLLSGFAPDVYEYEYTLIQDEPMPVITYDVADKFQTVVIIEGTPDGTAYINVTAENGSTKLYTIHFPIQRSSNAYLESITVNNKPIEDFDKEQFTYRITLPYGTTAMPIVNYTLAIPAVQRGAIEYDKDNWSAVITVTAENGTVNTYSLTFTIAKSDNALLSMITLDGVAIPAFRADSFEYNFTLPYGTMTMPVIAYVKANDQQLVTISNPSQWSALITVTSGDGNNQNEYLLTFNVEQNAETRLADLQLFGQTIIGFNSDTLNYSIVYPAGTDSTELAKPEDILAIAIDSLATVDILQVNDELITITVTAQNGQITVYSISQRIGLPDLALLKALFVDSTLIRHFDPETFEYTYLLPDGALLPSVEAVAQDSLATVDITPGVVDSVPTLIYCTAQDGTEQVYTVRFVTAPYNDSDVPTANDVLMRHIAGTYSFLASTIRKNVQIGLYDRNGHLLLFNDVPACDPNSAVIETGIDGQERLVSVDDPTDGLIIDIDPGQIYFYVFFEMSKNRIDSGKIMITK